MPIAIRIENCKGCGFCKKGFNRNLHGNAAWCEVAGRDLPYITMPKLSSIANKPGVSKEKHEATYVPPDWCPLKIKDL